jgi:[ribosomal protein S5]-alanine N-acetyltransferase
MHFETLNTEKLKLRILTPELFNRLFENYSDDVIKCELGLTSDAEFNKEKKKYREGCSTYDRSFLSFLLVLKENNEVIGKCGYHNWYTEHNRAELGYILNKDEHKRKGYMSEALGKILEYGFNFMGLNRVEAGIAPDNIASLSLIKKYGFTQEGYLRQHYFKDGKTHDTLLFSLLKEEFQKTEN